MAKIKTTISLDPVLKDDATALFNSFGLDLSTAIGLFLAQAVREQKIPFEIKMLSSEDNQTKYDLSREEVKELEEQEAINDSLKKTDELMQDLLLDISDVK